MRIRPGSIDPLTGHEFVRLTTHAKERADEMHVPFREIYEALQSGNRVCSRPDPDGINTLVESRIRPDLLFCVAGDDPFVVVTVLYKSDVPYTRPGKV